MKRLRHPWSPTYSDSKMQSCYFANSAVMQKSRSLSAVAELLVYNGYIRNSIKNIIWTKFENRLTGLSCDKKSTVLCFKRQCSCSWIHEYLVRELVKFTVHFFLLWSDRPSCFEFWPLTFFLRSFDFVVNLLSTSCTTNLQHIEQVAFGLYYGVVLCAIK